MEETPGAFLDTGDVKRRILWSFLVLGLLVRARPDWDVNRRVIPWVFLAEPALGRLLGSAVVDSRGGFRAKGAKIFAKGR